MFGQHKHRGLTGGDLPKEAGEVHASDKLQQHKYRRQERGCF